MSKKYFVEVNTFANASAAGRDCASMVYEKYHKTVIEAGTCLLAMHNDIERIKQEAQKRHPRCKNLIYDFEEWGNHLHGRMYITGNAERLAFTMFFSEIRNEYVLQGGKEHE